MQACRSACEVAQSCGLTAVVVTEVHKVNGKDHGGIFEMTWVIDVKQVENGLQHLLTGIDNALVIARTTEGITGVLLLSAGSATGTH
jgi:hypothetical protein